MARLANLTPLWSASDTGLSELYESDAWGDPSRPS